VGAWLEPEKLAKVPPTKRVRPAAKTRFWGDT